MPYFSNLDRPLSPDAPCGINIDGDPEIQGFLTMVEGNLPASYRDFDRKDFDDKSIIASIEQYFRKSIDLRLLVLAAKTFALTENLDGFFECLASSAALLESRWDDIHPQPDNGDVALRSAYLQSFDDRPTVILPLQAAPLIKDKRLGNITHRSFMVAKKPALARSGETAHDEATLRDAFMRFEPLEDLVALRDRFKAGTDNLQKLRGIFIDKASYEAAPQFDLLPNFLQEIEAYLNSIIADRSPSSAPPVSATSGDAEAEQSGAQQTSSTPAGDIRNVREVNDALTAVLGYFSAFEPSSPAKLLVRQAHQLVGKSFVEAMQVLAPRLLDDARVELGDDSSFALNFAQLQELVSAESEEAIADGETREFTVGTRHEATELMKSVERFYRKSEPSSPIPLLLDRGRRFMARDFSSLLAEIVKKSE